MATPTLLEGYPIGPSHNHTFIPECPRLNREVCALHLLARRGEISMDAAERQLNTYLPIAASHLLARRPKRLHWLQLPLADAPHHTHLPDLGHVIHSILARCPLPGSLSAVIEHSIPCLRHTTAQIPFTDSQDVLLNLVLALLLGLYPGGTVRRPSFCPRAVMYARVHTLLTASREVQTEFCLGHAPVIILACTEYVARVLPAYIPAQSAFLMEKDANTSTYFRRIPALCDELRMSLDDPVCPTPGWPQILVLCAGIMDKVSRLKKSNALAPARDPHAAMLQATPAPTLRSLWDAPLLLGTPTADEYRILSQALAIHGDGLACIQLNVRISPLPGNLRRLQEDALARVSAGSRRATFLKSRYHICTQCTLSHKNPQPLRLRLDTLSQAMVCSSCMTNPLISIDMVGRVLQLRTQSLYLCPGCVSVQEYRGEQAWLKAPCSHRVRPPSKKTAKPKRFCFTCQEPANQVSVERVDHHTGRMTVFAFCQRHVPRLDVLLRCVNARQIEGSCC